ncbi:MAG TPA: GSCFA domain-containing protein [Saprospiraceae bacterium]|nr:GSCFA domain-containing protein [Saprospiraceae bacterium]
MNELYTRVDPKEFWPKITYRDAVTMAGSCFTEHISDKLLRYKYHVLSNPFGILFNPVSIANSFERIANKQLYRTEELVFHDGLYHSMDHHGDYSGTDKNIVLQTINSSLERASLHLSQSKFVFISLGSAKVYRFRKTGSISGNCHKIPQDEFESFRMTIPECSSALEKITSSIRLLSPDAHIIWTVSPVRHLRDGIEENQLSKSTLLLAIDQQMKNHTHENYFPAYEIMMDQLRDYRYYARDLVHPSSLAIDIIWDMFRDTYLESQQDIHQLIEKVHRAMEHRFIRDDKEAIRTFAEKQLIQIEHLAKTYPDLDWKEERQYFFQLIEPD